MSNETSPVFQDISFDCVSMKFENADDPFASIDFTNVPFSNDLDGIFPPIEFFSSGEDTLSFDELFSHSSFDTSPINSGSVDVQHEPPCVVPADLSPAAVTPAGGLALSFINPPEPFYHVRYLSEITSLPPDGNFVNTKMKAKKNISGRYLKGAHGRHITISFPSILSEPTDLYIRVTRLTVQYQGVSFIHPYPLLYSHTKKKAHHSHVIIEGSSIYFQINKEELCSQTKRFPHLILTRLKQCQLKGVNQLKAFDHGEVPRPFDGSSAKNKIAIYQLKKSQLDFRLVVRSEQTGEFLNTDVFCRSNALLEEEGVEWRKSAR